MQKINNSHYKSVVVLTGAGVSRPSGLPTYRGPGGLWNDPATEVVSTINCFRDTPEKSWNFWSAVKREILEAEPNQAHFALSEWQKKFSGGRKFTLITQNVDELHQRAGSENVVELHGSLFQTRCSNPLCKNRFRDEKDYPGEIPRCTACGDILRPDIVLFEEPLPAEAEYLSKKAFRDCDLFIAVGTSGKVSPASQFVRWAKYAGARTVIVNLEQLEPQDNSYDLELIGRAEELLGEVLI